MHMPKIRSAITASSTTPPARTACTSERGATAIAATWKIQAPEAISMPSENSLEANSAARRAQRVADVNGLSLPRATMLVQKADVGGQRAAEREQDAEKSGH